MNTYRRLNDGTKYYGLTWRGWVAVIGAGVLGYFAIRWSPFPTRATITAAVFVGGLSAAAVMSLSQQAIGPGRYLWHLVRWQLSSRWYDATVDARPGGVTVDAVPARLVPAVDPLAWDTVVDQEHAHGL